MLKRNIVSNMNSKENMTTRDFYSYTSYSDDSIESLIISTKKYKKTILRSNRKEDSNKRNKKKKSRLSEDNKSFLCNLCKKSYHSNPALYTHKRNKHNIFPISGTGEEFKEILKSMKNEIVIKYSDYESLKHFSQSIEYLMNNFKIKMTSLYSNPECILYNDNYNINNNKLYQMFLKITQSRVSDIMNLERSFKPIIDEVLVTYMITFIKITKNEILLDLIIKFCILLREYLNNFGWDFKKLFNEFNVDVKYDYNGSFCDVNDCEYIPDLINDFISVFIELDIHFSIEKKYLLCITDNFCNWLFVNNFTNFKINLNE